MLLRFRKKTKTFSLYIRTIRYLKLSQVFFYLLRRFLPSRFVNLRIKPLTRVAQTGVPPCESKGIYIDEFSFRFLNVDSDISKENLHLDWQVPTAQRLWQYHLHYFDYLRERSRPIENKDHLIQSWIQSNPQLSVPGWEPFTTSRRIVNWIFYFLQRSSHDVPTEWLNSLYLQTLWLERNDEKHILANHYFENLKALLFSGSFFIGNDADRWTIRAFREIPEQLIEQTLKDGGHYERSHQYHSQMLESYLDILNLAVRFPDLYPDTFVNQVRTFALKSIQWLSATLFPDGTIPIFNDSTMSAASSPHKLFEYADRLSLDFDRPSFANLDVINCPDSGYYGCRNDSCMFIIDCGDVGPSYQPGHTHCDFLSFELMLKNQRVIVDSGVCEYEPGPCRAYVRSTKAHNTVSVDGGEQSEIWAEFRVARRAKKNGANIRKLNKEVQFNGAFTGFFEIQGQIKHEREVIITLSNNERYFTSLSITDNISGIGDHTVESFVHFHPDIEIEEKDPNQILLIRLGSIIAYINLQDDYDHLLDKSFYCPEFGKSLPNQALILRRQGKLPMSLSYKIDCVQS